MTDKPIEKAIIGCLQENLKPVHLEVFNESYMHNVPKDAETHFKVLVVSDQFEGQTLVNRHRSINSLLKKRLQDSFPHALSIDAKTPSQWNESYKLEPSPNCRGGFGK